MTSSPKKTQAILIKMPIEESRGYSFQEENHLGECISKDFMGKGICGRCLRGTTTEVIQYSFSAEGSYCQCRFNTESLDQYLVACSTSSQPRRPGTGSGVLRRRCLSALQELVGRNSLPMLLSSSFKNRFYSLLFSVLKVYF